jgi:predicted permease
MRKDGRREGFDGPKGGRRRRELDEEMAFHLERLTEDLMSQGMEPSAARREALRRFGNPERVQEEARKARGMALVDELGRNLRFALRSLRRNPGFTAVFTVTLALTVALGATAWSVARVTVLQELPYPDADRLVQVGLYDRNAGLETMNTSVDGATWERLEAGGAPLDRAVYSGWTSGVNLSADGAAAHVDQQRVGAGYFRVLGVAPARGREFRGSEDVPRGPGLVILSHDLWTGVFDGDPGILGSTIRLKGDPHTVVGIMPEGFRSPAGADLWTPLRPSTTGEGGGTNYTVVARTPEGLSMEEVRSRLAALAPPSAWEEREGDWTFGVVTLHEAVTAGVRTPVLALLGGVALMLLVGWANLMGLQVTRTIRRSAELATRQALGSGRGALVRQIATENAVIGLMGGGLGVALALALGPWIHGVVERQLGVWQPLPEAGSVTLVGLALTAAAALVYATVPMVRSARAGRTRNVASGARIQGPGRRPLRKIILVGQLSLITVLLFSAALLARSYARLTGMEAGFEPGGVLTVQHSLDDARYADAEAVRTLFDVSLSELEALPGVQSAAVALTLPYERPLNLAVRIPGQEDNLLTNVVYVTPGFFETMGIPLLRGRLLEASDGPDSRRVTVANEAFVERYLGDRDPLASSLQMSTSLGEPPIVGVVGNVQQSAGWGDTSQPVWQTPTLYVAAHQLPSGFFQGIHVWFSPSWVVKGSGGALPDPTSVRGVMDRATAGLPTARIKPLTAVVRDAFARQRLEAGFMLLVTLFGLLLAAIGIYGVIGQEVEERRGEMGVRMAMGASPRVAVLRTAGGGFRMAALGLVLGLGLSVPAGRFLESLVWGVEGWDPGSLGIIILVLGGASALASLLPALRIGRLDPATVLRES